MAEKKNLFGFLLNVFGILIVMIITILIILTFKCKSVPWTVYEVAPIVVFCEFLIFRRWSGDTVLKADCMQTHLRNAGHVR